MYKNIKMTFFILYEIERIIYFSLLFSDGPVLDDQYMTHDQYYGLQYITIILKHHFLGLLYHFFVLF